MDFGTTNSGMAVYDGKEVTLLPLDPANTNPHVARTALYLTNDQTVTIGREAVNRYFDENVGRPVKMKKVWVGEVEVYGADMFYVTDVYAWTDVLSPGRLFLSIKSGLRDPEYQGTVVGPFYYSLENLIALYMTIARIRAERLLGREIRQVVLGRPVHFSTEPAADALAEQRLLESAFRAGFEQVYLQFEPTAAAYHYATGIDKPQNILVFDFGGGTLDITVMRLGGNKKREVLSTGGIPVAGDIFDQRLVRSKLPKHFGEGTLYGGMNRRLPLPKWIFDVFSNWQTIIELQTPHSRNLLREIAQSAEDRQGIEALTSLVVNNYALQMFDVVEAAKRQLSTDMATIIRLKGPGFKVTEMVTRSEFEKIIRSEILSIEHHLDQTIKDSGLAIDDIDAVIRTGGSSGIPAFRYMLMEKFGREKVKAIDTFSSVTSGLGIIAHGIQAGEIDARAHTKAGRSLLRQDSPNQNVSSANLALIRRRLSAQENEIAEIDDDKVNLVTLTADGILQVSSLNRKQLDEHVSIPLPGGITIPTSRQLLTALTCRADEQLLMVTSRYRFLLTTSGHIMDLKELKLDLAGYFQLKEGEQISAIGRWVDIKRQPKLILATSRGYARAYNLNGMIEQIEGPTPYHFDQPLLGLPVGLFGANGDSHLVTALDNGRLTRYAITNVPTLGIQAINRRDREKLAGSLIVLENDQILLATAAGYGRRLASQSIPEPPKPNSRGRVLIARKPINGIAIYDPNSSLWAITSSRLIPLTPDVLPPNFPDSTRSQRMVRLHVPEQLLALLSH